MKTSSVIPGFFAVFALITAAGCASVGQSNSAATPPPPVRLQIAIIVPVSMRILSDDDVIEAFGEGVRQALHEQGFKGHIKLLDDTDSLMPGIPELEIKLAKWKSDESGNASCTFRAVLSTPAGTKRLGLFTANAHLARAEWSDFVAEADIQDAARNALEKLADIMEGTGLITKVPAG